MGAILDWLITTIKALIAAGWYGKLTIHFEAGQVTFIRKEETIKPPKQ